MDFSFVIISFNHEGIILENLESMKFQIVNYGKEYDIDFILSDDASKDKTFSQVQKWVEHNRDLFRDVQLHRFEKNVGTVNNYLYAISKVKTVNFKVLAGDDLYYKNNIFPILNSGEFVISPTIKYDGEKIIPQRERPNYYSYIINKNKICQYLPNKMRHGMTIETPGVFFNRELIDSDLSEFLAPYKLIEDVPLWNYVLNKKPNITVSESPYIIYRVNTGVSTSKKPNQDYLRDLTLINKHFVEKDFFFLHVNLSRLSRAGLKRIYKIRELLSRDCSRVKNIISNEEKNCNEYLLEILQNVETYKTLM